MKFKEILTKKSREYGINIDDSKIQQYEIYKDELLKWNKRVNLTRITKEQEFATKVIIDSLMVLKYINIPDGAKVIDIGTGAGIPGLIIKITRPDISLTLIESIRKKTDFLLQIIKKLNLDDVTVINERAEITAHNNVHRQMYHIALSRAVSSLNVISELCLPFVRLEGLFVSFKGFLMQDEIDKAKNAIELLGGRLIEEKKYMLDDKKRSLVIIKKERISPQKYPRKTGIPEKRPL